MIIIDFDINENQDVTRLRLNTKRLTGYERAGTLKDAVEKLSIENTARTFSKKYRAGELEKRFEEKTINQVAEISNLLADIFKYEPFAENTDEHDLRPYMNPLQLLEYALNMIAIQNNLIKTPSENGDSR